MELYKALIEVGRLDRKSKLNVREGTSNVNYKGC